MATKTPLIVALFAVSALGVACGGDDNTGEASSDALTAAADNDGDAGDGQTDAADDGLVLPDGSEIDPDMNLDEIEEELEVVSLCEAIPLAEVTALFAETIGELSDPLAIRNDFVDNCAYAVEGETGGALVAFEDSDAAAAERCTADFGTEPGDMVEGLGDGPACRKSGSNRNTATLLFSVDGVDYEVRVSSPDEDWNGDVLRRSEEGWALVEGVAALAADNLG